jgi:hypothetical protein
MTAHILVSGSLFRAPERTTSKAGRRFVSATIKVRDGEQTIFWRIVAFSVVQMERQIWRTFFLMRDMGDPIGATRH